MARRTRSPTVCPWSLLTREKWPTSHMTCTGTPTPHGHVAAAAPHFGAASPQFFASTSWPGYTMRTPRMQSTKSGGPVAGTWAVVESLGDAGYLQLTHDVLEATNWIVAGTCDPFTICVEMAAGVVRPAADVVRRTPGHRPPLGLRGDPGRRRRAPGRAGRRRRDRGRSGTGGRRPGRGGLHRVPRRGHAHRRTGWLVRPGDRIDSRPRCSDLSGVFLCAFTSAEPT